jgi:ribosome maturation factor RimP
MSGSSRHGSVRPPAAAGRRPGTGGRSGAAGQSGTGQSGTGGRRASGGGNGHGNVAVDADKVAGLLTPVASALDMDLEGVRITAAGRRRLLRIVVDADGGVSLHDIALVSRELSAVLDDSAVMGEQPYTLEVSSPGVDRPLTERRHWRRAIGRLVVAPLTAEPSDGDAAETTAGTTVEGRVTGATADGITIDVAGESRRFGYGDLGPGKIKVEFAPIDAVTGDEGADGEDLDDEGADEEGSDGY